MNQWSFDILRQSGWDLWTWVCFAACAALVGYAIAARAWRWRVAMLVLLGAAIIGTLIIAVVPMLHRPVVGLLWTVALMIVVSVIFYWQLRSQLESKHLGILLALRIAAVVLLVPMLFEPVLRFISRPSADR